MLKGHFPREKVLQWREACLPLLYKQIELEGGKTSRGAQRYYVTFPFSQPFSDPGFYEDPDIIGIVEQLAGKDFVMCQLASDTPMYQLAPAGNNPRHAHADQRAGDGSPRERNGED